MQDHGKNIYPNSMAFQNDRCEQRTCVAFLSAVEELNSIVSEAFLQFFVKTVGHYASYVKRGAGDASGVFEKRRFYKAIDSKTTRHFVKKFMMTQMFDLFIQEVEQRHTGMHQGES